MFRSPLSAPTIRRPINTINPHFGQGDVKTEGDLGFEDLSSGNRQSLHTLSVEEVSKPGRRPKPDGKAAVFFTPLSVGNDQKVVGRL